MVLHAFFATNESEPFPHLVGYVDEESISISLRHFGPATDAKPKHIYISNRFFLRGGLGPLCRLLPLVINHVNLWMEGVKEPIVGKNCIDVE